MENDTIEKECKSSQIYQFNGMKGVKTIDEGL